MQISEDSWHFKLFVFMSQWNAAWHEKDDYLDYPKIPESGIGLCPYMRMILIWGPLAILSNFVPLAFLVGALFLFPASANGAAGVGWTLFTIAAMIGSGFAIGWLKDRKEIRDEAKERSQLDPYGEEEKPDGFFKLLWTWVHDSICPVLEVKERK